MYKRYRKRRFYSRRRPYRPRRSYRPRQQGLVQRVWNDLKWVKNQLNVEFHAKDPFVASQQSVAPVGSRLLLNGLQTGDDIDTRHGRQIRMKSVHLKLNLEQDAASTHTRYRIVLLIDRFPQGATPAWTDVFDGADIHAMRNLSNRRRFCILKDWSGNLVKTTNVARKSVKHFAPLNFKVIFNDGNVGTIADIENNALYLFMITDDANDVLIDTTVRIRWIDN